MLKKKQSKRVSKRKLKQKLSLTIKPEIRAKAERIARREHRSVSSLFEYLIHLEYLKLKPEKPKRGEIEWLSSSFKR
jgi:hypothetical protein